MSRPFSQRGDDKLIRIPVPKLDRKEDGSIRRTKDGHPVIRSTGYIPNLPDEFRTSMLRGTFLVEFGRLSERRLSHCALLVFLKLLSWCRYQSAELLFDDATGEPIPADGDGNYVLAALGRPGTITKSFTREQLAEAVGATPRAVCDTLKQLSRNLLIRAVTVPPATATKHRKKGGRPEELLRYEINPDYAYNGPLNDGLGYAEIAGSFREYKQYDEKDAFDEDDASEASPDAP